MNIKKEIMENLLSSAMDCLGGIFGGEWLILWGIDNGLTNEEICHYIYDDELLVKRIRKEWEEENPYGL